MFKMDWYIDRHVYYIPSEHFLAYLTLVHLLSMILTGYGVLRHCADLYEIQGNIWAISVSAVVFLYNMCATKGRDTFFKWFLPLTILVSLTTLLTLSAYHGILMVFVVHLPLVVFVLTGIPCRMILISCISAIILGTVFHVAVVSSLYSEFQGHMSLAFSQNVTSWLRFPTARGFSVIMMDSYVVTVQAIIGALCYQRFRKLGKLIAMHRGRPAHHLGSFDELRALEDEFFPQVEHPLETAHAAAVARKSSVPIHQAAPEYVDFDENDDGPIPPLSDRKPPSRTQFPLEKIERYRFKNMNMRSGGITTRNVDEVLDEASSIETDAEVGINNRRETCSKEMETVVHSYNIDISSCNPTDADSSCITGTRISIDSSVTSKAGRNDIKWSHRSKTTSINSELSFSEASSRISDRPMMLSNLSPPPRKRPGQSINLFPPGATRSAQYLQPPMDSGSNRPQDCFASDSSPSTGRGDGCMGFTRTRYGSRNPSRIISRDVKTSAASLLVDGLPQFAEQRNLNEADYDIRIGSFEGQCSVQHTEEAQMESERKYDGKIHLNIPTSFPISTRMSQRGLSHAESIWSEPMTSSQTLNTLLRVMPTCGYRLCIRLLKNVGIMTVGRDKMRQSTWTHAVKMPDTNVLGMFSHTRVEAWYIAWMNEFNMSLYTSTAMETLVIFVMGVLSDLLIMIRMYMTLRGEEELGRFFSPTRITIMALRYGLYPIAMVSVLSHLLAKKVKKPIFFFYRSIFVLCVFNIVLTFSDMWSCMNILKDGYAIQNSLYMCSMLTSSSLLLLTRMPTLLCIYVSCFAAYTALLWGSGYDLGHNMLETLCQFVVAIGCVTFHARPVDTNRRMLFSSYTLPYLLYLEAMKY